MHLCVKMMSVARPTHNLQPPTSISNSTQRAGTHVTGAARGKRGVCVWMEGDGGGGRWDSVNWDYNVTIVIVVVIVLRHHLCCFVVVCASHYMACRQGKHNWISMASVKNHAYATPPKGRSPWITLQWSPSSQFLSRSSSVVLQLPSNNMKWANLQWKLTAAKPKPSYAFSK